MVGNCVKQYFYIFLIFFQHANKMSYQGTYTIWWQIVAKNSAPHSAPPQNDQK